MAASRGANTLRVDLMTGEDHVASAICEGPKANSGG